jgi:hypothetical protein
MKNLLIKMLGGMPKDEHIHQMRVFLASQQALMQQVVDKHEMQSAWEQLKQEQRRLH